MDVENLYETFIKKFNSVLNTYAPLKNISINKQALVNIWLTKIYTYQKLLPFMKDPTKKMKPT